MRLVHSKPFWLMLSASILWGGTTWVIYRSMKHCFKVGFFKLLIEKRDFGHIITFSNANTFVQAWKLENFF